MGHNFRIILRQFYDNLRTFVRCKPILGQIYDNANFHKKIYEQFEHYKYDKIY